MQNAADMLPDYLGCLFRGYVFYFVINSELLQSAVAKTECSRYPFSVSCNNASKNACLLSKWM